MADAPQEIDDMERMANVQAHEEVDEEHRHDEEDSDESCGFCKFMKGGACRQAFIDWSKCVDNERESGNENFAEQCQGVTMALRECMLAHREYYGPLLEEEEEVRKEMLREEEEKRKYEAEQAAAAGSAAEAQPAQAAAVEGGKS